MAVPCYDVFMNRFTAHLKTVNTHRAEVRRNCFKCGLYRQGLTHDLSKYSPQEFLVSVRCFQGFRSPYTAEKELYGYSLGWLHHKGHNRHHWEYWYDMLDGVWQPIEMPFPYVVEMVCDRVAACKVYEKDKYTSASALNYFEAKNDKQYMHPKTAELLRSILTRIRDEGEDAAFAWLKEQLREWHPQSHLLKNTDIRQK